MSHSSFVKKLFIAAIFIVILLAIIGLTKNRLELSALEKVLMDFTAPVQRVWTGITNSISKNFQNMEKRKNLQQEKNELSKMVRELRQENRQLKEYTLENERLKMLLAFQEKVPYKTIAARIIGRSVSNWLDFLTIDKGADEGLRKGMTVIGANGLVGQISLVSNHTAQVLLIMNQNSAVSGLIQESRENGIVEGNAQANGKLMMERLPRDAKVKAGDHVFSSGLGGVFPKGIYIGRVVKVKKEPYDISQKAVLVPAENFNTLEEVLVITNNTLTRTLTPQEGGVKNQ